MTYQAIKAKYIGQKVGVNPQDFGQCTGWVQVFVRDLGLPFFGGNAIDYMKTAPAQFFDRLPINAQVQPGDIFIGGKAWGVNGHTGTVDQLEIGQAFMAAEQNNPIGGPVNIVFHQTRDNLIGFLRPKVLEDSMDSEDLTLGYIAVEHRDKSKGQVTDAEINGSLGKKPSDWFKTCISSPEWLGKNDILLRAYPQALQTIDQLNQKIQALQNTPTQQEIQTLKDEVASLTSTINNLENKPQ